MDNPQTSYAQVRLFGGKKEEEKLQQIVYVNNKLNEFVYLLNVMNSCMIKYLLTNLVVMFHKKYLQQFTLIIYFFYSSQEELEHWR